MVPGATIPRPGEIGTAVPHPNEQPIWPETVTPDAALGMT